MAAEQGSGGRSFGRRLEKWVRDSAELRALVVQSARGLAGSPEDLAVRRYHRSGTALVPLPHPNVSPYRYDLLSRRHRELSLQLTVTLALLPALLGLGFVISPLAAQVVTWSLLLPLAALAAQRVAGLRRLDEERHLHLRGGLADAWGDWVKARQVVEGLDNASQARAAIAANEARMQALVLALGRAEAQPHHRDTADHAASREWVYRTAAKAVALARAEKELEEAMQRQVDAGDLQLAPEGDVDALDQALDAARELTRGLDEPDQGRSTGN